MGFSRGSPLFDSLLSTRQSWEEIPLPRERLGVKSCWISAHHPLFSPQKTETPPPHFTKILMDLSLLLLIFLQISSSREEFLPENDKFPFIRPISEGSNSVRSKRLIFYNHRRVSNQFYRNINVSLARNVTFLLDSVLRNYNRQFRPGFNSKRPILQFNDANIMSIFV